MPYLAIASEPETKKMDGRRARQTWALPVEESFLEEFLTYVFTTYWDQIVWGPIIEGAAYEFTCPQAPSSIGKMDGYLTLRFGKPHLHLCIGSNEGEPGRRTPPPLRAKRLPSRAEIFRQLDRQGAPISWGFEMWNGAGEPMLSIFFANPFAEPGDNVLSAPKWENLAMWRDISGRYLRREPEDFDETSKGFVDGNY